MAAEESSVGDTVKLSGIRDVDQILSAITRNTRTLILNSHDMGRDTRLRTRGVRALCSGFDSLQETYGPEWGLKSLTVQGHGLTDKGVRAILAYAGRDPMLEHVDLRRNPIEFRYGIDEMVSSLNSSHLTRLTLRDLRDVPQTRLYRAADGIAKYGSFGCPVFEFPSDSFNDFFDTLNAPRLTTLDLGLRCLSPETIGSISTYISSPRSRNMRYLYLASWGDENVGTGLLRRLTGVIRDYNFSLFHIDAEGENEGRMMLDRRLREAVGGMDAVLQRNHTRRIPEARVRTAALRYLSAARILLNARPGPPTPSPPAVPALRYSLRARTRPSTAQASPAVDAPFRLFDLPPEIVSQIIPHMSCDPGVLSWAQQARLTREAESKKRLRETIRAAKGAGDGYVYEWLRWAGVDSWEEEREVRRRVEGDESDGEGEGSRGGGEDGEHANGEDSDGVVDEDGY